MTEVLAKEVMRQDDDSYIDKGRSALELNGNVQKARSRHPKSIGFAELMTMVNDMKDERKRRGQRELSEKAMIEKVQKILASRRQVMDPLSYLDDTNYESEVYSTPMPTVDLEGSSSNEEPDISDSQTPIPTVGFLKKTVTSVDPFKDSNDGEFNIRPKRHGNFKFQENNDGDGDLMKQRDIDIPPEIKLVDQKSMNSVQNNIQDVDLIKDELLGEADKAKKIDNAEEDGDDSDSDDTDDSQPTNHPTSTLDITQQSSTIATSTANNAGIDRNLDKIKDIFGLSTNSNSDLLENDDDDTNDDYGSLNTKNNAKGRRRNSVPLDDNDISSEKDDGDNGGNDSTNGNLFDVTRTDISSENKEQKYGKISRIGNGIGKTQIQDDSLDNDDSVLGESDKIASKKKLEVDDSKTLQENDDEEELRNNDNEHLREKLKKHKPQKNVASNADKSEINFRRSKNSHYSHPSGATREIKNENHHLDYHSEPSSDVTKNIEDEEDKLRPKMRHHHRLRFNDNENVNDVKSIDDEGEYYDKKQRKESDGDDRKHNQENIDEGMLHNVGEGYESKGGGQSDNSNRLVKDEDDQVHKNLNNRNINDHRRNVIPNKSKGRSFDHSRFEYGYGSGTNQHRMLQQWDRENLNVTKNFASDPDNHYNRENQNRYEVGYGNEMEDKEQEPDHKIDHGMDDINNHERYEKRNHNYDYGWNSKINQERDVNNHHDGHERDNENDRDYFDHSKGNKEDDELENQYRDRMTKHGIRNEDKDKDRTDKEKEDKDSRLDNRMSFSQGNDDHAYDSGAKKRISSRWHDLRFEEKDIDREDHQPYDSHHDAEQKDEYEEKIGPHIPTTAIPTKSNHIESQGNFGDDNEEAPTHPQSHHIEDPFESPTHSQLHHADDQYGLPTHNQHRHVGDQYELPTHSHHRHVGDQYEIPTHNHRRNDGDQYEIPTHNHRRNDGGQYEPLMQNRHRYDEDQYELPTHNQHHVGEQYELQTNPLHSPNDFINDKTFTPPLHRTTRPLRSKIPENTAHPRKRMHPTNHHITMQQNQHKRTFAPTRRTTRNHHRTTAKHKHSTPVHRKTTHHHTPTRAMYHQATPHHTTRHHTPTGKMHRQASPHHTTRHRIPTKPRTRKHSTHQITHRRTTTRHAHPPRTTTRVKKVPTKRKHTPTKRHKPTFNMEAILRSIKEIVQPKIKRDSQPKPAPTPDINRLPVPKPYVLPLHDPTQLRILCFGDSLTAGYYKHGKAFFPYCSPMRNMLSSGTHLPVLADVKGIVGEMTHKQMTNRLPLVLGNATFQYDWVIILGGTNDILHVKNFADDQEFLNQLENVWQPRITKDIEKLHSISYKYGAHTLLLTVPENSVESWPEYKPLMEMRNKINTALKRFAYSSNGLTVFCDTAKRVPRHSLSPAQESALWDDHLHMTPMGYTKMARVISECLEPYLPHRRAG